jgi:hypothetical protein
MAWRGLRSLAADIEALGSDVGTFAKKIAQEAREI